MVNAMAGVLSWCPGAEWVDSGSGQCYAVFTQSSSFSDAVEAQQLCHNSSSELASIPDSVAESIVLELLRNVTVCENRCVVEKYCDEYVSVCVCLCVCVSVREDISRTTRAIFAKFLSMLPMAVARSSSGVVVIRYVLPVLLMTSCLSSIMAV